MISKLTRIFNGSAGGVLLAAGVALLLGSRVETDMVLPHDPLFSISIRYISWILGGIFLAAAWVALSGEPTLKRAMFIAWFAIFAATYRLAFEWMGVHGLRGYLEGISAAFGISTGTAESVADLTLGYLVLGSYLMLIGKWWERQKIASDDVLKIPCSMCGGNIEFALNALGQKIPCPHCQAELTLTKPI